MLNMSTLQTSRWPAEEYETVNFTLEEEDDYEEYWPGTDDEEPEPEIQRQADWEVEEEEEEEEDQTSGGFDHEFIDQVLDSQKCAVCLFPMRDAVQTALCGHRFCRTCLRKTLRTATCNCPTCREPVDLRHGFYQDIAWSREISCLHVKCKMSGQGCHWTGEVMHAEKHLIDCPFVDVTCSNCESTFQRRHLELHLSAQCPHRIVQCIYCKEDVPYFIKPEHEDESCTRFPLPCKNHCGSTNIPREEMDIHLRDQCPMTEVVCPYYEAGCPFKDKRAYLSEHIDASTEDHVQLLLGSLADLKQKLNQLPQLEEKINNLKEENKMLKQFQTKMNLHLENCATTKKSPVMIGMRCPQYTMSQKEAILRKCSRQLQTYITAGEEK